MYLFAYVCVIVCVFGFFGKKFSFQQRRWRRRVSTSSRSTCNWVRIVYETYQNLNQNSLGTTTTKTIQKNRPEITVKAKCKRNRQCQSASIYANLCNALGTDPVKIWAIWPTGFIICTSICDFISDFDSVSDSDSDSDSCAQSSWPDAIVFRLFSFIELFVRSLTLHHSVPQRCHAPLYAVPPTTSWCCHSSSFSPPPRLADDEQRYYAIYTLLGTRAEPQFAVQLVCLSACLAGYLDLRLTVGSVGSVDYDLTAFNYDWAHLASHNWWHLPLLGLLFVCCC